MMIKSGLTKKYAQAYCDVFGLDMTLQQAQQYAGIGLFLHAHRELLFWLATNFIDSTQKHTCLKTLAESFSVDVDAFMKLVDMLSMQSRLFLLDAVLHDILEVYKEYHNIMDVRITSALLLTEDQAQQVLQFFSQYVPDKTLQPVIDVDADLIAGIRVQSDTFLWEDSIAQKMRTLRKTIRQ